MIALFEVGVNNISRDYEGALLTVGSRVDDVGWPAGTKKSPIVFWCFQLGLQIIWKMLASMALKPTGVCFALQPRAS